MAFYRYDDQHLIWHGSAYSDTEVDAIGLEGVAVKIGLDEYRKIQQYQNLVDAIPGHADEIVIYDNDEIGNSVWISDGIFHEDKVLGDVDKRFEDLTALDGLEPTEVQDFYQIARDAVPLVQDERFAVDHAGCCWMARRDGGASTFRTQTMGHQDLRQAFIDHLGFDPDSDQQEQAKIPAQAALEDIYDSAVKWISADPDYPDTPPEHWQDAYVAAMDALETQEEKQAFIDQVAGLGIWGTGDDNDVEEPGDGLSDSHQTLMSLIAEARGLSDGRYESPHVEDDAIDADAVAPAP